jgi:hypothetical protein
MGTIIKIVIGLLIITGSFNAARAALNNYQFEDAIHQGMLFDPAAEDGDVVAMVMRLAKEYEIPLAAEDISVRTQGQDVHVSATYTDTVVVVPGIFATPWTFTPTTSVRIIQGNRR